MVFKRNKKQGVKKVVAEVKRAANISNEEKEKAAIDEENASPSKTTEENKQEISPKTDVSDKGKEISNSNKNLRKPTRRKIRISSSSTSSEIDIKNMQKENDSLSNEKEETQTDLTLDIKNDEKYNGKKKDKVDEEEPKPAGIRLVPLNLLLRQDILNKNESKSSRKSRGKKNASLIEISSGEEEDEVSEDEQVSVSISSQSNENSDDVDDDDLPLTSKRNSTNKKNGIISFKEPLSPSKYRKKSFTLKLSKMPENVNELMKNYRLSNNTTSWSETDDFENMIETSKIDRTALDKAKNDKEKENLCKVSTKKATRGRQKITITSDSDSSDVKKEIVTKKKKTKKEPQIITPTRSRSTRAAAQNRKQIIEDDTSESIESESESDDDVPLYKTKTNVNKKNLHTKKDIPSTSESDVNNKSTKNSDLSETDNDSHSKKNKNDTSTTDKNNDSSRGSNLKITINLNQNKVINHSRDEENSENSSKNDKKESSKSASSESDNEPIIKIKKKLKAETSESENNEEKNFEDEILDDEKAPICDQKFRNRHKQSKFESTEFDKLKEKIQERKKKKPNESESETKTKDISNTSKDKGKENLSENHEEIKSTVKSNKRKRVISSSDEEEKEEETEENDIKKERKKKEKTETPAKRHKKRMSNDSDYENTHSESEEGAEPSEKSSSDEEIGKRKAKNSSPNEDDEELDDLDNSRVKAKRRKRIKKMDSSEEEGSDGEKGKKSLGRKAIRKIIRNDKLDISTKEAAKIERERKQRIEERQKMYNQTYDERPEEIKEITSLVLDFNEETKEPLLEVDKKLVKKLKPHQANGVKFMWDACFESLERCENENGSGCILAHCMGLGKTLQVITLVHTLIVNGDKTGVTRVLVVCPLNTVLNWVNEFHKWLRGIKGAEDVEVYEINKLKQNVDRANKLMEWHNEGGVMILSYDMFRNLSNDTGNRLRKKIKESLQTSLLDPGPDLVICDEGHLLKNEKTSISKAMNKLRTLRRIVLTGTPLQNNLKEYYCMVQFVKPNLLGKYQEYMNRFVNPITNGQYTDSTEYDIQIMRRRAHVLHKLLDGCVQRRDYSVLAPFLPPKHEYVMSIKLTPMQIKLYKYYMENRARQCEDGGRKGSILFQDFQNLQRIWSAPKALRYNSDRYEVEMQRKRDLASDDEESIGSIKDFLDDSESAMSSSSENTDDEEDDQSDGRSINSNEGKSRKKKKEKSPKLPRRTRATVAALPEEFRIEDENIQTKHENPTEWWMQICPEEELNNIEHSSKLMVLMSILQKCEAIGDKLLVFSQSLYSLDVIEHFLNYIDEQTQTNAENTKFAASWSIGLDYFRLDGSTPVEQRNQACKLFNSPDNPRARLFLISTRAGGLGINLVAANRVVIFDVSWNPSHDVQSIFRVYRFGQTKPCYIYRFLAFGTMEEKIYERQVTKQAISKRVIDEQQIDRHYNQNDLQELYKYELEPDDDIREIPILPKDRLFAEVLKTYEDMIYKYHEHDTLLENKEEETLDEEERKAAWEEFEAEKNRPQYVSYNSMQPQRTSGPVTSNNVFGIRNDILLKLLSIKARLDNPSMNDSNLKHAIPILMQELYRQMDRGELTLYHQLLALSSSLEVPSNYSNQFQANDRLMHQTYNMPSTSGTNHFLLRQQLADRQKSLTSQLQQRHAQIRQQRSPPRIMGGVIEID
ncbi:hypothetical protein PVAND_003900 [Polypedilum vanderplanki]|uniref:DNA helicase n=1 Tax=Polypedilum vanderplanki TaxID=319348 RepID=A0A9J6BVF6_POLVA|nr:hypothetical protein PVAND_003900 [Polypedilum vanderplanki]